MGSPQAVLIVSVLIAVLIRVFWRVARDLFVVVGVACVLAGAITLALAVHSVLAGSR